MAKPFTWVGLGDMQMPYQDDRAIALTMKVMKALKPDAIDVVGDAIDYLEYSRFSDGTTDEFYSKLKKEKKLEEESDDEFRMRVNPTQHLVNDSKILRDWFGQLRKQHPNADIHFSIGNHEVRARQYFDKKFPEYLDEVTPELMWGVDSLGITWSPYEEPPVERFAGIHVHHGNTTTTTGLAVKNDIENYNVSLMRGHDHRGGVVYKSYPMTKQTLVGIGTGHLCNTRAYGLKYTNNPTWELGFAVIRIHEGKVFPQFINIQDNTCVVDGRVFTA